MLPERKTLSLPPQTVASNGTNGFLVIDTRPSAAPTFNYCFVDITLGPGAATTAPTTLALYESDTDVASNYATISGFVGGTNAAGGFTLPSYATSAGSGLAVKFGVDCTKRKRFLKVSVVPGTTATVCITASLVRPDNTLAANTTGSGGDFFIIG